MIRGFVRILLPVAVSVFCLYSYMEEQNTLTQLRIALPSLAKEIKGIQEENTRLKYQIDLFESPQHLLQLAGSAKFRHLKHPLIKEVLTLQEGIALQPPSQEEEPRPFFNPKLPLAAK